MYKIFMEFANLTHLISDNCLKAFFKNILSAKKVTDKGGHWYAGT